MMVLVGLVISTTARADEDVAEHVGEATSGLPGLGRVAVASPRTIPYVGAGVSAGYGFTESLPGESGAHHRLFGTLGVAAQPLRFLSAALTLDGRYDKHPDDVLGSSSTALGEPRLLVRAAKDVAPTLALGAQIGWLLPGDDAPSFHPGASSLDALALVTYAPAGSGLALAGNAGYRVDESAKLVGDRSRIRPGDRLSLRASDADAVLLGVGASERLRKIEVLGELTWEILVGSGAPSATDSPLRAGAGVRYHLANEGEAGLALEGRAEVDVGGRPAVGPAAALAPIDPRFAATVGLRYVLPLGKKAAGPSPLPDTTEPKTKPEPAPAAVGSLRGRVTGDRGAPLEKARVTVKGADDIERTLDTGADGTFTLADLPAGRAHVTVKAADHDEAAADATIAARETATLDIPLKRTIKPGQLRGLVRSFDGKPLAATIRVEPLGIEATTDAEGSFRIDVPPGAYQISVEARGYAAQKRPVQVEENGVTILNADLRRGP